ncbi:MAG: hypothetical protein ABSG79_18405 [Bryobacteraceae bacterium]|jgi:hypothetical protein
MTCSRCGKDFDGEEARCPHCGEPKGDASGLFQTSTVLISTAGADLVYRSVEEIPPGLRTRLLKSTSGGNAGTILIADRRGRQEIAKTMGKLPDAAPGQLVQAILGDRDGSSRAEWLTRGLKRGMAAAVVLLALALALAAWVLSHHWR